MDRVLETEGSARRMLVEHLAAQVQLGDDELYAIADGLLPAWEDQQDVVHTPGTSGLQISRRRWVIRDDDLRLMDNVLDGLKASAGVGFFIPSLVPASPTPVIAAIVGIVVALVKLGQQIRRKGISLQPSEYAILAALHDAAPGGLSEPDLLAVLRRQDKQWIAEEMKLHLEALKEIPAKDGTKVLLAQRFPDGNWRASGI